MQLGVEKAAEMPIAEANESSDKEKVLKDATKLAEDIYVDDKTIGGIKDDVKQMIGDISEDGTFNWSVPKMIKMVGFKVKALVQSGDMDAETIKLLLGKVLGYSWEPTMVEMTFKIKFNTSKKWKGMRSVRDLTLETLEELKGKPMTTLFKIKLKAAIKKVIKESKKTSKPSKVINWNGNVSSEMYVSV